MRYHYFDKPKRIILDLDLRLAVLAAEIEETTRRLTFLKTSGVVRRWRWEESRTTGHYHVIVWLVREWDAARRRLLALFLGSDPWRELASWQRHEVNGSFPFGCYVVSHRRYKGLTPDYVCRCPAMTAAGSKLVTCACVWKAQRKVHGKGASTMEGVAKLFRRVMRRRWRLAAR